MLFAAGLVTFEADGEALDWLEVSERVGFGKEVLGFGFWDGGCGLLVG